MSPPIAPALSSSARTFPGCKRTRPKVRPTSTTASKRMCFRSSRITDSTTFACEFSSIRRRRAGMRPAARRRSAMRRYSRDGKRVRGSGMGLLSIFITAIPGPIRATSSSRRPGKILICPLLKRLFTITPIRSLAALKKQGTAPDMVQIGNEVTNGLLWPDGRAKDHFDNSRS